MKILIVGAQLGNKGAESMLYVSVSEMAEMYPGAELFFATTEEYNEDIYKFRRFFMKYHDLEIALGGVKGISILIKEIIKDAIKLSKGKKERIGHHFDVKKLYQTFDLILDISGYNLGVKWSRRIQERYLDRIKLAKKYNIPVYILPQSFGPFDYDSSMQDLIKKIRDTLSYPCIIFAREEQGYRELVEKFNLGNVVKSNDLVLQSRSIKLENVFKSIPQISVPVISSKKTVGIIPNAQCFRHGSHERNMTYYRRIIKSLIISDYSVIIFRHSREDLSICNQIYKEFQQCDKVRLEEREFSCLEYNEYIKQFCFVICSRYHGIVHAYKNGIPCIALGWAEKYSELVDSVNQHGCYFDITEEKDCGETITWKVKDMIENHEYYKSVITDAVKKIQTENCFFQLKNTAYRD